MDADVASLVALVKRRRDAMVDLLRRLALAESPSDDLASLSTIQDLLQAELESIGLRVWRLRRPPGPDVLLARPARRSRGRPQQLLIGHCDTVWPIGTLRDMPVQVEGDVLRGPGVFDMKGGLVQMIHALAAVGESGVAPAVDPIVIINADEEIGSRHSHAIIQRWAARAHRAFILEPALGLSGKLKTARKAVGRFTITIRGKAAHAGVNPEEGVSAIYEMTHQVQRLFALNDSSRGITVNVGNLDAGVRPNVIAPRAQAIVDVRVPTAQDAEQVTQAIYALQPVLAGTEIDVEGGIGRPAMEPTPRNQALWQLACRLGQQAGIELEQAAVGGASDGNTTSLYTATLDGLGAVGDGAHALHEHIQISKMVERTTLLALLLLAPVGEMKVNGTKPHVRSPATAMSHTPARDE